MKVQINSLEALERLIGNDNELEIDIRNSVVNSFTKKHLKSIANDLTEKCINETIKEIISKKGLTEKIKSGWRQKEVLTGSTKLLIQENIDSTILNAIAIKVTEAFDKHVKIEKINQRIENVSSRIEREISESIITKRIDDLVDQKIKEKLNL